MSSDPDKRAQVRTGRSAVQLIEVDRALERPSRACASQLAALDTSRGCALGCLFCPHRFRGLAAGSLQLRANLPAVLERELRLREREGRLPAGVLVDPASDPFQPVSAALALTHEALRLLLDAGLTVYLRTRSLVPEGFGDLLRAHADRVRIEVTLFSMDPDLAALYEPGAADPQLRLETIRRLRDWGIAAGARIEPLLPFVSDTAGHLEDLVRHLRSAGAERAVASYLVLRPKVIERLRQVLPTAHFHLIKGSFRGQTWRQIGVHQMTKLLPDRTRRAGYDRLAAIARRADLELAVCACDNPGLGMPCLPDAAALRRACRDGRRGQLDLFDCA
jgi:DNA repair photolyase